MSWFSRTLGIAVLGALTVAPSMAARRVVVRQSIGSGAIVVPQAVARRVVVAPRVVIGRPVIVRPYAYYGPSWYGYWGPGWYYPYGPAYDVRPATGEVKIDTHLKDATVYVDGGYVGPISKFKKFWLKPGNHDIALRDASGRPIFQERVQVIVDRTVEIRPPA